VEILATRFLAAADSEGVMVEIVFVDDGSTDTTWESITSMTSREGGRVRAVRHVSNQGIPRAWLSGVEAADGEWVCLIDSDLQNPPEAVFQLWKELRQSGADLVRGVRKPVVTQPLSRILMSRVLNAVLNFVFGMSSQDNKSGFVMAKRDDMIRIIHHRGRYSHYQTFIGVAAHSLGLRTSEVDTPFEDRRNGVSFLSGKSASVVRQVIGDIPRAWREFGGRSRRRRSA
jgi:glycosyltransferase involved in cell wall biosynthesis